MYKDWARYKEIPEIPSRQDSNWCFYPASQIKQIWRKSRVNQRFDFSNSINRLAGVTWENNLALKLLQNCLTSTICCPSMQSSSGTKWSKVVCKSKLALSIQALPETLSVWLKRGLAKKSEPKSDSELPRILARFLQERLLNKCSAPNVTWKLYSDGGW